MPIISGIISEFVLILGIFLILYIIFSLGRAILGLLLNLILGFISIFLLNAIFNLGIRFDLIVIIIVAVLGLPGTAVVVLLKLIGVSL
ncbi:MAG: pro-sigmaK processing inhibitor BofA family protein [Candidatus Micrarchaeota archaeon]|nr:pro-sigmaK processing inhibitor BofA family protein [Candidatus Micrarchaeota archaeon]